MLANKSIEKLLEMSQNGNKEARDYIVTSNMKIVYKIAGKYLGMQCYESAVQEGFIGLIKAVDEFDINRNVKFTTFAYSKIVGEIYRFIRDRREDIPLKIRREDFAMYGKMKKAESILRSKLQREPTLEEIAKYIEADAKDLNKAINTIEKSVYLYNTKYENKGSEKEVLIIDSIENQNNISEEQIIQKMLVKEAIDKLTEKQKKIIQLRYFDQKTQNETSKILNMTQVTVSRNEKRILKYLRNILEGKEIVCRDTRDYIKKERCIDINDKNIGCLTERQYQVVKLIYGKHKTQTQVAEELGVSKQNICELIRTSYKKLNKKSS